MLDGLNELVLKLTDLAQVAPAGSRELGAGMTQRALGFTVRGYVQEPTKDTVPVRELFPRRICLRVTAKSHVGMVLGDQAYERGAWANRIPESDAGTGYVWGEGLREPLRIRAGWVPDEVVKALEAFVTSPAPTPDNVAVLRSRIAGEIEGGAAA